MPSDYGAFLGAVSKAYAKMATGSDRDAVQKVVAATYEAATDGTTRLRYQPTDDIRPIVEARRSSSEEQYWALMSGLFTAP